MGAQRTSFAKLQRDRAKKAKAAAKREERQDRAGGIDSEGLEEPEVTEIDIGNASEELSAPELLELIERIHHQFDSKQISYDEFEEKKAELLARLPID